MPGLPTSRESDLSESAPQGRIEDCLVLAGVYKQDMKLQNVLRVLAAPAYLVIPVILGQALWPAHTKWGFTYGLGFSLIGGISLGI